MPSFIGCKINLVSKAGIRYEGILYTIDPKESTVALSKVKSFGTENRKVDRVIPPRDEIYEFIIFRGSDIQDLNVCETTKEPSLLSEDSAIVRVESSISGNIPSGVMSAGIHHIDGPWAPNNDARSQINDKLVNNNSKMIASCKSKDELQQASTAQPIGSNRTNQQNSDSKKQQMFRKMDNHNKSDSNNDEYKYERPKPKSEKVQKYSEKYINNYQDYDYGYDMAYKYQGNTYHASNEYGTSRDFYHVKQPSRYRRNDYRREQQYYANIDNGKLRGFESSDGLRDYTYAQYYDYKPRNNGASLDKYSYDHHNSANNTKPKKKPNQRESDSTKKPEGFKEDYDFESANAIIAKELANLNISQDKKDLKEEECDGNDGDLSENSDVGFYDKSKSFFDHISSEMIDRANGKTVRPMNRKEERKINFETFGVAESNRNGGARNASKWNRNSKYFSKPGRNAGYGTGSYKSPATTNDSAYKKDSYNNHKSGRGYGSGRRPVLADGPGRGDD